MKPAAAMHETEARKIARMIELTNPYRATLIPGEKDTYTIRITHRYLITTPINLPTRRIAYRWLSGATIPPYTKH